MIVYSVIWHVVWWFCGGPINYFSFAKWLFLTPPGKPAVLLNNRLKEYKIELKDELDFYYEIDVIFSMGFVHEQLELYTL